MFVNMSFSLDPTLELVLLKGQTIDSKSHVIKRPLKLRLFFNQLGQ